MTPNYDACYVLCCMLCCLSHIRHNLCLWGSTRNMKVQSETSSCCCALPPLGHICLSVIGATLHKLSWCWKSSAHVCMCVIMIMRACVRSCVHVCALGGACPVASCLHSFAPAHRSLWAPHACMCACTSCSENPCVCQLLVLKLPVGPWS